MISKGWGQTKIKVRHREDAFTFESLAVASRPLQRQPRRNDLYSTMKNTNLTEIF